MRTIFRWNNSRHLLLRLLLELFLTQLILLHSLLVLLLLGLLIGICERCVLCLLLFWNALI
jgi:hypothetical protein